MKVKSFLRNKYSMLLAVIKMERYKVSKGLYRLDQCGTFTGTKNCWIFVQINFAFSFNPSTKKLSKMTYSIKM